MFNSIKLTMEKLHISDYWVVIHDIKKYDCDYAFGQLKESTYIQKRNVLFFVKNNKLGKIQFSDVTEEALTKMVDDYLKNGLYHSRDITYRKELTSASVKKYNNVNFEEQIKCIKFEVEQKANEGYMGLVIKDVYVLDKKVIYYDGEIIEEEKENNWVQIYFTSPYIMVAYGEELPGRGMLDDLIERNKLTTQNSSIDIKNVEYKKLKFSQEAFSAICRLLVICLNGLNIVKKCSIFCKEDFGTQIFRKEISITDNPFVFDNTVVHDDEGIVLKIKKIVNNGILEECLNNIFSAGILNLTAGNCYYNHLLKTDIVEPSKIYFEYKSKSHTSHNYDAYIFKILDNNVILDGKTGNIEFSCMGLDNKQEYVQCMISTNLIEFFNGIVATGNEYSEYNDCIVPEVIVHLGGSND